MGDHGLPTLRETSTKGFWRKMLRTPSQARGSISRHAPSSGPWSNVSGPNRVRSSRDPACGTGGFFLAAYDFITNPDNFKLDKQQKAFLKQKAFHGNEIVANTRRLCLMNKFLQQHR